MQRRNSAQASRFREIIALALTFVGAVFIAALILAAPPAYLPFSEANDMAEATVCSDTTDEAAGGWPDFQRRLHDGFDATLSALRNTVERLIHPFRRALGSIVSTAPASEIPGTIITPYLIEIPPGPTPGSDKPLT